jgi:hypothetical protein
MLVRLTERQAAWVRRAFVGHPREDLIEKWYDEADTAGFSVDIVMSPEAWLFASKWLYRNIYTSGGGVTPTAGSAGQKAHQRVQRAINQRRTHPAFNNSAALGTEKTMLTGWQAPGQICAFWEDCGHPSSRFVLLLPTPAKYKDEKVTMWSPFTPDQVSGATDELSQESVHVCFCHETTEIAGGPES